MSLGLYKKDGSPCTPQQYSTGASQLDSLNEMREAFRTNNIVIFKGMVGSGKSVVGIRMILDRQYGRGIVAVPTIVLSEQYERDYDGNKYFEIEGHRASLRILKGRQNFSCPRGSHALADQGDLIRSDKRYLPCTRKVEEPETRLSALEDCNSWGFVFPKWREGLEPYLKDSYDGLNGRCYLCGLDNCCDYWGQFDAYLSADCLVMNEAKWRCEVTIGRLPKTEITVIDEADMFLDSLTATTTIMEWQIERVASRLVETGDATLRNRGVHLFDQWKAVLLRLLDPLEFVEAYFYPLLAASEDPSLESLRYKMEDLIRHRTLVKSRVERSVVKFAIPYPDRVLADLQKRVGGDWLLMSATFQDSKVLKSIYNIEAPMIEGETRFPGTLIDITTGRERSMRDSDWRNKKLPSVEEKSLLWFESLRGQIFARIATPAFEPLHSKRYFRKAVWDEMMAKQDDQFAAFMIRPQGILSTTKADRGVDFKGVKAIFVDKYPNPGLDDLGLSTIKERLIKEHSVAKFWEFYDDIARREFIQQIGRVLRQRDDVVEFWSPDVQSHKMLPVVWKGKIVHKCIEI